MGEKNVVELPYLPDVRIIKNGKPVDTSAIDNYDAFMAYLMAAAQTAHLARIRRSLEDLTPVGGVQNLNLSVTPTIEEVTLVHPSQSIWIVNDGPGDIYVAENSLGSSQLLHIRDEMWDDFKAHKLLRFYIWSAPGTTATARGKVKY